MKAIFFANTDWYLYNFRLAIAERLRREGWEVFLVSPPGSYGERLRQLGFRWMPVPMERRSLNPFSELAVIYRIYRLYRHEMPDLVQHFTIKCVVYGSIAARLAGIAARVNSITGMGYVYANQSLSTRWLRFFVNLLLSRCLSGPDARVIVQNGDDLHQLVASGVVRIDQCRLIAGSGVNVERFAVAFDRPSEGKVSVVMATRLIREKGVHDLVEAIVRLRDKRSDIEFLLAGSPDEGNPSAIRMEEIAQWEARGLLRHLGHVDDMAKLLRDVDIVVLPTRYREGVPRVLIEAAASGLPIVATDMPGCRDIVQDGVNGYLVGVGDIFALADRINTLAQDAGLRMRMGRAGRSLVEQVFSEDVVVQRTMGVYREICAS